MSDKSISDKQADILIVDDTPENLDILVQLFNDRNYNFRPVTNGKTALSFAQNKPPDLIFLDINIPKMNDFEVFRELNKNFKLIYNIFKVIL